MYYVVLHSAWWFLCQHIWSSNHLFSLKIFLNLIPMIQQVLPCFPMSGAIVSFQFLIPELPLLWVCTVSQVEPTVLLNAAVSLASPPGAQRWQALPRQLRSPECHSLLLRGRAGADIRVPLPSAVLLGWWEPLLWVVGGGPALWMPPWLEAGVPGSSVADAHWPVSVGTAAAGAQGHMAISSAATGFSGAAAQPEWLGARTVGTTCAVVLVPALFFVPAHLPLDIPIYGFSGILSVLGRAALLSCGCLTGCWLRGRDKGCISIHHDADINTIIFFWFVFGHTLQHVKLPWPGDQELNPCPHNGNGKS